MSFAELLLFMQTHKARWLPATIIMMATVAALLVLTHLFTAPINPAFGLN